MNPPFDTTKNNATEDIIKSPKTDQLSSSHSHSENEEIYYASEQQHVLMSMEDDALTKKMNLVNNAINQIGFTPYHWKLFCLNGMGFAVDSLLTLLHSVTQNQIAAEYLTDDVFNPYVSANYVGLFLGAFFWGFSSDLIGRRIAFQVTLFGTAVFGMVAAAASTFTQVCSLSAVCYWFAGGNLVLDAVTFLEFLPSNRQRLLTAMSLWWGLGQIVTCAFAWPLITKFNCGLTRSPEEAKTNPCLRKDNMGWRYTYISCGAFVMVCALLRVFVIRMMETPKYDVSNGKDEQVIKTLNVLAESGKTVNPLHLEDLQACGVVYNDNSSKNWRQMLNPKRLGAGFGHNVKGLFSTKRLGWNTSMVWLSWTLIGLAYPLYNAFLPTYLQKKGADLGDGSLDTTYRNNFIVTACSIIGPIIAGLTVDIPKFGRRGTMAVGGTLTMIFMFVYAFAVKTPAGNLGVNCVINVFLNMYYGTLYAFTPETIPSTYRATGNGIGAALARVMGVLAPVIYYYGVQNGNAAAPVIVLAALFGVMAIVALCFPYETRGFNSM